MPHPSLRRPSARWLARLRAAALVTLLAVPPLAATACGSSRKEGEAGGRPAPERTTLQVENRSFLDHNVYVINGSQRVRLGTITGSRTQTFTIPSYLVFGVSTMRFLADPIGGTRTPISDEIRVAPGEEVQLVIPP